MRDILRKHHISFQNAFSGCIWAFKSQPNFRIHAFLSMVAIFAGLYYGISQIEMVIIVFTILLGFTVEMVNTSIEAVTDLVTSEWRQNAKIAKDVSAGMMLMVAIGALFIAGIIYTPYIFSF